MEEADFPYIKQRNKAIDRIEYRLHFARSVHYRHPFPPTGDAAYSQHAGG